MRRKKRLIEARENSTDNSSLVTLTKRARKCLRILSNNRRKLPKLVEEAEKPNIEPNERERLHSKINKVSDSIKTKQYFHKEVRKEAKLTNKSCNTKMNMSNE